MKTAFEPSDLSSASALALLLLAAPSHAQQQAAAEPVVMPDVSVTATRVERPSFELPVSIDTVGGQAIREDRPQVNLSEALNAVPGIVVQNRQNYAQDLQISSRGFGARSAFGVRGLRLISGGVIQIFTADGPRDPTFTGKYSLGSYDTSKWALGYGGTHGPLNLNAITS